MKNKKLLDKIFTTVKKQETKEEVPCFTLNCMQKTINHTDKLNPLYPVYKAVSEAMRESDLSFDFSYLVANKALDILIEAEDWEDMDAVRELIDRAIPVYNYELMKIYQSDWNIVDDVVNEMGSSYSSINNAQQGWYFAIERMVEAIMLNLENVK